MAYGADAFTPDTPSAWPLVPHHVAYRHTRERVTALLRDRPDAKYVPVPACPGWTVGDLLNHLVENCRFAETNTATPELSGRPLSMEPPEMTRLSTEWSRSAAVVEAAVALLPGAQAGSLLLLDAFTHELDARVALGAELPPHHPGFPGAFEVALTGFAGAWRGGGCRRCGSRSRACAGTSATGRRWRCYAAAGSRCTGRWSAVERSGRSRRWSGVGIPGRGCRLSSGGRSHRRRGRWNHDRGRPGPGRTE